MRTTFSLDGACQVAPGVSGGDRVPGLRRSSSSSLELLPTSGRTLAPVGDERELLRRTAEIAADFVETLDQRPIRPEASVEELRATLGGPLAETPTDPLDVIESLAAACEPGVVGMASGRYFGFVIGGRAPGRSGRRLADIGVGSERRPRCLRPVCCGHRGDRG